MCSCTCVRGETPLLHSLLPFPGIFVENFARVMLGYSLVYLRNWSFEELRSHFYYAGSKQSSLVHKKFIWGVVEMDS